MAANEEQICFYHAIHLLIIATTQRLQSKVINVFITLRSYDLQTVLLLILKFQVYFSYFGKPDFYPQLIGRLRQLVWDTVQKDINEIK